MKKNSKSDESKAFNGIVKLVQAIIWLPLRIFVYYLFYKEYLIISNMWLDSSPEQQSTYKYPLLGAA